MRNGRASALSEPLAAEARAIFEKLKASWWLDRVAQLAELPVEEAVL